MESTTSMGDGESRTSAQRELEKFSELVLLFILEVLRGRKAKGEQTRSKTTGDEGQVYHF